jgi:threonine/homoserine/homoserine lactone efflux protein
MLDMNSLPLFIAASISLLLIPGPAVMYIVTRSIHEGWRSGLVSVIGIHIGTGFHILAAVLGLSAILLSSALAFDIVKYLGAAYLVYIGIRTLLSKADANAETGTEKASLRKTFSQAILVNVLNPKTALFFFAFLPQFADSSRGSVSLQMLFLGLIFVGLGLITDSCYALLAGSFGSVLKNSRLYLNFQRYFAGTVYIGLGITAALTGAKKQ